MGKKCSFLTFLFVRLVVIYIKKFLNNSNEKRTHSIYVQSNVLLAFILSLLKV